MHKFGVQVVIIEPSFYKTPLLTPQPLRAQIEKMYAECPEREKPFYGPEYVDFCKFLCINPTLIFNGFSESTISQH
jgi:hypothetical protein